MSAREGRKLPKGPWVSNCILWAAWRWATRGGYVWMRKSRNWIGPHFGWTRRPGAVMWSYAPKKPKAGPTAPPLFRGAVVVEKPGNEHLKPLGETGAAALTVVEKIRVRYVASPLRLLHALLKRKLRKDV